MLSFCALKVSFEKIYCTFAQEPGKLFRARLKEKTFAFVGNYLEHSESGEFLCIQRPNSLTVSTGPGYEFFQGPDPVFVQ